MNSRRASHSFDKKVMSDNTGVEYSNYVHLNVLAYVQGDSYAEYLLNGQYKEFNAKLTIPKDENQNSIGERQVKIYLDDKIVSEYTLEAGAMPIDVKIPLTGANKIKFELTDERIKYANLAVAFFNGEFIK